MRIRAVIKSDGVAHLMSQQGPPFLCYTVSYLSAGKRGKTLNLKQARVLQCEPIFLREWHWQWRSCKRTSSRGLTEIAATRRGCVTPITFPSAAQPASIRYWKESDGRLKKEEGYKAWDRDTDVPEQQTLHKLNPSWCGPNPAKKKKKKATKHQDKVM